jgi:hypothetical protein
MKCHCRRTFTVLTTAMTLCATDVLACSGPGAARAMRISEEIGSACAGISAVIVIVGCVLAQRRFVGGRIPWMIAPMIIHPRWWMDAYHGDCGSALRFWSVVTTLLIAMIIILTLRWPRRGEATRGRWTRAGVLSGSVVALLIAALLMSGSGVVDDPTTMWVLVFSVICGTGIAGGIAGAGLYRSRVERKPRIQFGVKTLLLLPLVLVPLFVALLPILPYEALTSMSTLFSFVVLDDATGRPIPGAALQVIDPRFALDDAENQGERVITGSDGSVEYFIHAIVHGRAGLLGKTETITYAPFLIRVEAPGHRVFFTALAADPPKPSDRWTAPPLGLSFPPPPTATIRMTPEGVAAGKKR